MNPDDILACGLRQVLKVEAPLRKSMVILNFKAGVSELPYQPVKLFEVGSMVFTVINPLAAHLLNLCLPT
jgi:hypothetical protein